MEMFLKLNRKVNKNRKAFYFDEYNIYIYINIFSILF